MKVKFFSILGSVFRIESVRQEGDLCLIQMNPTTDGQIIVQKHIKEMHFDTDELSITMFCGILMCDIGQYDQSFKYFQQLLLHPNGEDPALIHYQYRSSP